MAIAIPEQGQLVEVRSRRYVVSEVVQGSVPPNVLGNRAVEALRDHRRKQVEERLQFPGEWEMPELVFPNNSGGPLNPGNVSNSFKQTLERLGLPVIRFHDTRHTAATLLLQAGTHVKLVSEMLGHSTIVITLDTYSHVIPTMHEEAARTMDKLLGGDQAVS